MKKKIIGIAALAIAGIFVFTACTSSDSSEQKQNGKADGQKTETQAVTEEQSKNDNTQTVSGTAVNNSESTSASAGSTSGSSSQTEAASSGTAAQSQTDQTQTIDTANGDDSTEIVDDSDNNTADPDVVSDDIWTGTYVEDSESVTLNKIDENTISFAFAQSGISGQADVDGGSQAVYHGDDHYVIVFNISGTVLSVDVSNEEDYDASESPLIGTYVRDAEQ